PSRVRNRKFASTSAPSRLLHEATSSPQSLQACANVNRKPGISRYSPFTRRNTSSAAWAARSNDMGTSDLLEGFLRTEQPMYQAPSSENRRKTAGYLGRVRLPTVLGVTSRVGKPISA